MGRKLPIEKLVDARDRKSHGAIQLYALARVGYWRDGQKPRQKYLAAGAAIYWQSQFQARLGYARDLVKGMWMMRQQPQPVDYVLPTGEGHSVRAFTDFAFAAVGRRIDWREAREGEVGVDANTGKDLIRVDRRYFRPTEVHDLLGDASKALQTLGWRPEVSFIELVAERVKSDLEAVAAEAGRKDRSSH